MDKLQPVQLDYEAVKPLKKKRGKETSFAFWLIPLQIPWFFVTMFGGYVVLGDPEPTRKQFWVFVSIVSMPALAGVMWELVLILRLLVKRVSTNDPVWTGAVLGLMAFSVELALIAFVFHKGF